MRRKKLLISKSLEGRFLRAIATLNAEFEELELRRAALFKRAENEIELVGLKTFAARLGVDQSNLRKSLENQRKANTEMLDRIDQYFRSLS